MKTGSISAHTESRAAAQIEGPVSLEGVIRADGRKSRFTPDNVPEEKFAEYFENGEFTANPIGIKFDPDELFGRLNAGESEEALLQRPDGVPPSLEEFPKN